MFYIALLLVYFFWGIIRRLPASADKPIAYQGIELFSFALVAVAATLFQVWAVHSSFGQIFTADEHCFARIYTEAIMAGRAVYGGLTQSSMALLFAGWYQVWGPGVVSARSLSALFGLFSLVITFLWVRKISNSQTALLTCVGLALSAFFFLYVTVALEVVASFFVPSLLLLLLGQESIQNSRSQSFGLGLLIALGQFTYPGIPVFFFCWGLAGFLIYGYSMCFQILRSRTWGRAWFLS
jgi:hypothetical protein